MGKDTNTELVVELIVGDNLNCTSCGAPFKIEDIKTKEGLRLTVCPYCGSTVYLGEAPTTLQTGGKFCVQCGASIPASARFCPECSAPQYEEEPKETPDRELELPGDRLEIGTIWSDVLINEGPVSKICVRVSGDEELKAALRAEVRGGTVYLQGSVAFMDGSTGEILERSNISSSSIGGVASLRVSGKEIDTSRKVTVLVEIPKGTNVAVSPRCGTIALGDISGELTVHSKGIAQVEASDTTGLSVNIGGSGNCTAYVVRGNTVINIAGSGDVRVEKVCGNLSTNAAGSGNIKVRSVLGKTATLQTAGSGNITVRNGKIDHLTASIVGSGDIAFGGTTGTATLSIVGSGDIRVRKHTKTLRKSVIGSGDIRIG